MILKNLTLVNFRKFKNTTIEFPDGVTGVVGLNGAGKSTVFEAIAWVLYGPVAARTSAELIRRKDTIPSDSCRVELEFVFEDENYRIVREMKGKNLTTSATATINGKVAATTADGVNRFIQKKLGLDFKSFYTSIFAKQKELNALSTMNASERRPLILRMLGIDSLDAVIKEVRSDKKNKETLIERLSDDLTDENGRDKDELYKEEIKQIQKNLETINNEIKKSKQQITDFKKQLEKIEKQLKQDKQEYEKLSKKKEKLSEKQTLFENKKKLEEEIKQLKNKITGRQKILGRENKKLDVFKTMDKDILKTEKRVDELSNLVEKNVKNIQKKQTLKTSAQRDISEINSKKQKIVKLGSDAKCPTCERVLSEQYNFLIKKFDSEIKNKEKEIKKFETDIKSQEDEKEKLVREKTALDKKINYLNGQLREKEGIDATIKHIAAELKNEKTILDKKQSDLKKIGPVSFDIKQFENIKRQLEKKYENYQKDLDIYNDKKDNLSEMKLDLEKKQGDIKVLNQEIKSYKEKIQQIENFKKQIKEEKKTVGYLGALSNIMSDFRTFLISRVRPTLSSYASDFYNQLTDGKYPELELDENYDLMIYDDGELYNINRFSGGEEDLANLCLRLAISEVITERAGGVFNFVILDEIFGSQDYIRRQNIMKALNSLSGKFRQIFLITHVDDVKNDMENVIFVSENNDGTSSVRLE
jgi:exonuclease SbcC